MGFVAGSTVQSGLENRIFKCNVEVDIVELEDLLQIRSIGIAQDHAVGQSKVGLYRPVVSELDFFHGPGDDQVLVKQALRDVDVIHPERVAIGCRFCNQDGSEFDAVFPETEPSLNGGFMKLQPRAVTLAVGD